MDDLFKELFGEESNSDLEPCIENNFENLDIRQFSQVPGLILVPGAFNELEQHELLRYICHDGLFSGLKIREDSIYPIITSNQLDFEGVKNNQAMRFGQLSPVILDIFFSKFSNSLETLFPFTEFDRKPLFDQAIFNMYGPGEGIKPHVDLAKFEDGIVGISLLSSATMVFSPVLPEVFEKAFSAYTNAPKVPPLRLDLQPGDVFFMSGPARYNFTHCIPARPAYIKDTRVIRKTEHRISITLRKVGPWSTENN